MWKIEMDSGGNGWETPEEVCDVATGQGIWDILPAWDMDGFEPYIVLRLEQVDMLEYLVYFATVGMAFV